MRRFFKRKVLDLSQIKRVGVVKVMIFRRGKASYLYNNRQIFGDHRGNQETAKETDRTPSLPQGWLQQLWGNSQYPKELLGRFPESYWSFSKPTESGRLELRRPEHCILVLETEFKLSEATSASTSVALHSVQRLVTSFATVRIVQWAILHTEP